MLIQRFRIHPLNLLFGALVMLLGSFRIIAVPFLLANAIRSTRPRSRYNRAVQIGLLLTLLSPIDIALPFFVTLVGTPGRGVRICPVVSRGTPVTGSGRNGGDFVHLVRNFPGIYRPVWAIVWWGHDEPLADSREHVP